MGGTLIIAITDNLIFSDGIVVESVIKSFFKIVKIDLLVEPNNTESILFS
jgi:hypothetical protein